MKLIKTIFFIGLILLVAALTALNAQLVEVKYLIGSVTLPLILVCFVGFVVGLLLGILLMSAKMLSLKKALLLKSKEGI